MRACVSVLVTSRYKLKRARVHIRVRRLVPTHAKLRKLSSGNAWPGVFITNLREIAFSRVLRCSPYAAAAASRTCEFNPTRGDQKKREARRVAYQALYTASAASWNTESGASSRWQKGADTCFHGVVSETGVCRSVICGSRRKLQRSLRVLQEHLRGRATQRCRSCRSPSDPARTPHVNSEKL